MSSPLEALRDYSRQMADNPEASDHELWTQIADEIDDYLDGLIDVQPELF